MIFLKISLRNIIYMIKAIIFQIIISLPLFGQVITVKYGPLLTEKRTDTAMEKWRTNRFGQFIHWGLYAIPGGEWEGKIYTGAAEWLPVWAAIPSAHWDSLQYDFNPRRFDPKKWAKMAKHMGARYVTITTKHHDGFCLWPSKFTEFDVESTPYNNDLLRPFVDAYTEEGIDVYFYYSILDWHHPNWRKEIKSDSDQFAFEQFKSFTKNQLEELLKLYPEVKGFWFDGTWDQSWKLNGQFSYELENYLKKIHPGLIVNSRMRADEHGSRHRDSNGRLMGDYESGYERRLPDTGDTAIIQVDWESCMTIPENQWGFHKDWTTSHVKSPNELIEMLIHSVSLGGNFLLNFGPKADGTIRREEKRIAKEIGQWMEKYGEAVYNCGHAGLDKQDWGYYTKPKVGDNIYMTVFNIPINKKLKIRLPKGEQINKAYLLDRPNRSLEIQSYNKEISLVQIKTRSTSHPFVIVLELKRKES